jgi:hypothetical protein
MFNLKLLHNYEIHIVTEFELTNAEFVLHPIKINLSFAKENCFFWRVQHWIAEALLKTQTYIKKESA